MIGPEGARYVQRVFAAPYFPAVFPEIVRTVLSTDPQDIDFNTFAPNGVVIASEYAAGADAQGFDDARDPNIAFDLLLGASIVRLLATGNAPSAEYARQVGEVIIAGLRAK